MKVTFKTRVVFPNGLRSSRHGRDFRSVGPFIPLDTCDSCPSWITPATVKYYLKPPFAQPLLEDYARAITSVAPAIGRDGNDPSQRTAPPRARRKDLRHYGGHLRVNKPRRASGAERIPPGPTQSVVAAMDRDVAAQEEPPQRDSGEGGAGSEEVAHGDRGGVRRGRWSPRRRRLIPSLAARAKTAGRSCRYLVLLVKAEPFIQRSCPRCRRPRPTLPPDSAGSAVSSPHD